ncbi:MAG: ABC transporter permease [Christensenella sp.]|nr:ABC transporter permease [Christensenella sp.]
MMKIKKSVNISNWVIYIGMVGIFIAFTIICSALGKDFLNFGNVMNIVNQASINAVLAVGMSLVILTGGIDLSVGSIVGFVGIFMAMGLRDGMSIPVMLILCLLCGAGIGLFNGLLVSFGKVPAFITTLGSMQMVRGFAQIINGGQAVSGFPLDIGALMKTRLFDVIPIGVIYVLVFYVIMAMVLRYTKFGRYVYAVGGNAHAAKLSGVKVKQIEVIVYVLCGIFAAFAGVMLLSRLLYADPSAGNAYEMEAIAAVVIGGISMSGGKGRITNTVVGAIILATLTNGLQIMNVPTYYQTVITGLVVVIAVFADKRKERKEE